MRNAAKLTDVSRSEHLLKCTEHRLTVITIHALKVAGLHIVISP